MTVSFDWRGGNFTGFARFEELHPSYPRHAAVRVWPEGWTHGIWIGCEDVLG
jgi:hypothetical protein